MPIIPFFIALLIATSANATIYDNPYDQSQYAFGYSGGPCGSPACNYGASERYLEKQREDNWNEYLRQQQQDELP